MNILVRKMSIWKKKRLNFHPPQVLAIGFLCIIAAGALLLSLPFATHPGHRLSWIDALFESVSAVCVTGLVVTDTGTTFTIFGQIVLLVLIQVGGLGFMTFGVIVALMLGKRIGLSEKLLIQRSLNQYTLSDLIPLVKLVVIATFLIEALGALLLAVVWSAEMGWGKALYYGIFHSISAFNNAGFDITSSSLTQYVGSVPINLIISVLFIVGGIGFTVLMDVCKHKPNRWSLNTKLVLLTTFILNLTSAAFIFVS